MLNRLLKLIPNPKDESLSTDGFRCSSYDKERKAAVAERIAVDPSLVTRLGIHVLDYLTGGAPAEHADNVSKLLSEILYRVTVNDVLREEAQVHPVIQTHNFVTRKAKKSGVA